MEVATRVSTKSKPAKRQKGITLLEYAIIAGLIAAVAIAIISALGAKVNNSFSTINSNWNR